MSATDSKPEPDKAPVEKELSRIEELAHWIAGIIEFCFFTIGFFGVIAFLPGGGGEMFLLFDAIVELGRPALFVMTLFWAVLFSWVGVRSKPFTAFAFAFMMMGLLVI